MKAGKETLKGLNVLDPAFQIQPFQGCNPRLCFPRMRSGAIHI
jgi:hypothetical protein